MLLPIKVMNWSERKLRLGASLGALVTTSGCSARGAPSFILLGAYFPDWIVCALLGIVAAILTRVVMVAAKISDLLPLQLFVCSAVGLVVAVAAWLIWSGR